MPNDAGEHRLRRLRRTRHAAAAAGPDWAPFVDRALHGSGIGAIYQPIVDLQRREVVGYEALARFDAADAPSQRPDRWFDAAHQMGAAAELNAACIERQLARRSSLPANHFLAINVDPDVIGAECVQAVFGRARSLRGVVIELTEHRPWVWDTLAPVVEELRRQGARFAVDDAGTGYSGLHRVLQLRPSILKLDRALISGLDRDEAKASLVEMVGHFAGKIDAWVLAEGVETIAEAHRLCDLSVPLAQGYLFGRGDEGWATTEPGVADSLTEFESRNRETLHRLVDPVATVAAKHPNGSPAASATWIRGADRWRAVIDEHGHPIGLCDADGTDPQTVLSARTSNVNTSPVELASHLATGPIEPSAPVIVTDDAGRYLGLVTIRRLLQRLTELTPDHPGRRD